MYKAIIFDVDGTILNPKEGLIEAIKYTIKKCKLPELDDKLLDDFIGPPIQNSLIKTFALNTNQAQIYADIFREYYKNKSLLKASLYENILDVMQFLKSKNYKIGIATYKREDYAIKLLKHFGLTEYTDVICGGDNTNKLTKTDILQNCITLLSIDKKNCIMIGDSNNDAIAASSLGIDFMGCTYGFGFKNEKDLKEYHYKFCANNVNDIILFLQ